MSAFPKADVQNVGGGIDLNVCFSLPKADVKEHRFRLSPNVRFRP